MRKLGLLCGAGKEDYSVVMPHDASRRRHIRAEEHDSYCVLGGRVDAGLILLCDHAGNAIPPEYGTLGLPPEQLKRHIAYDIGADRVTRSLAAALGVPALLTRYSRLLIDPNRGADDPTLIMRLSDGAVIPGNRRLDEAERERRTRLYYAPYHRAIASVIDRCLASGTPPMLLSIHSFTESWKATPRPWHVGVLWDRDLRLAKPLLDGFYAEGDLIVGDNEPYSGQLEGDCLWQHATLRGLANALIEIRQDLIRDADGQESWAQRLFRLVGTIMSTTLGSRTSPTAAAGQAGGAAQRNGLNGDGAMTKIDNSLVTELEAAAFRRLVGHLRERTDVQNLDLMNMAGFCRNCLANWYQEAASAKGLELTKEGAREVVYGMPYKEWQAKHQKEASAGQKAAFAAAKPHGH
jgi:predicted N-formylglutamate amidohydrolase